MAEMIMRYETFVGASPQPQNGSSAFVHESFPPGTTIVSNNQRKKSKVNGETRDQTVEKPSVATISPRIEVPVTALFLPKLSSDKSATAPPRSPSCSYIRKQKSYLKMKGLDVSKAYKLNRHKDPSQNGPFDKDKDKFILELHNKRPGMVNLPTLYTTEKTWAPKRSKGHHAAKEDVWKPSDSSKLGQEKSKFYRSVKELDEEISIPGFTPRAGVKDNRLGKVLSTERMNALLGTEEPVIPRAFYTEATILSPKVDTNS